MQGLEELRWSSPRIAIEFRWFAGDAARAQAQAKEIVELGVDIIVANGTPALGRVLINRPAVSAFAQTGH